MATTPLRGENYNPSLFVFNLSMAYSLAVLPKQYCHRQTTGTKQLVFFSIFPKYFYMQIIPIELVHYETLTLQSYTLVLNI